MIGREERAPLEHPRRPDVVRALEEAGVIAVVRLKDPAVVLDVAAALWAGGVRAIEITTTVPRTPELIAALAQSAPRGMVIGAGTVLDSDTAERVIHAGARFVVSPVFRPRLVAVCHEHDISAIPGCFSPTEIFAAFEAGADLVKIFPAAALGPGFIKDLRGPLPQVRVVPTGGITRENAGDWIRAGAAAIGVGSALVDPAAAAAGRFDAITETARAFVEAVRLARGQGAPAR